VSLYPELRPYARTPAHIDRLVELLRAVWLRTPELRFEQVTSRACDDYHYTPDERVEANLRRLLGGGLS